MIHTNANVSKCCLTLFLRRKIFCNESSMAANSGGGRGEGGGGGSLSGMKAAQYCKIGGFRKRVFGWFLAQKLEDFLESTQTWSYIIPYLNQSIWVQCSFRTFWIFAATFTMIYTVSCLHVTFHFICVILKFHSRQFLIKIKTAHRSFFIGYTILYLLSHPSPCSTAKYTDQVGAFEAGLP